MNRGRLTASLILGALLSWAAPTPAFAKAVEDVLLGSDPQDIMITVLTDLPVNAPTVRTYAGSLRIRMYDAKDTPLLKLNGDGGAVKSVDVANGSDQSAAIVVTFTDKTRLAPNDVRMERDGAKVVLRIARGLLPALRENAPAATPVAVKPPPVPAPVPAPAAKPAVASAPVVPAPPAAEPVAAAKPAPAPIPETKKPATALGQPAPKQDAKKDIKLAHGGDSSAIPVMLAVSALLALCYGVLRLVMKKNSTVDIPAIDVIAQKRLGPRHQLVIVRAFDRDYLLSIQGGQTTVVARSTRKRGDEAAEEMLSPLPFKRTPVGELPDLAPPKNPSRAPSKPASAPPKVATREASREMFEDDEVTFGGELFKQALEQRERVRDQTASMRLEAARAEARAELARLENDRDEYVVAPKPTLPGFGKPSLPSAVVGEEELVEAPKAADAMMSESVSGLLRLRKASGR